MSGLLGSRSAADSSVAIAAFQSSATSAFFPAANSGSSFAQSASEVPTVMVQIGQSSDPGFASEVRSESPRDGAIAASHTDVGTMYAATPPTSAPQIEASMIERIILALAPETPPFRAGRRRGPSLVANVLSYNGQR